MDSPSAVYSWLYLFREAYHFIESGETEVTKGRGAILHYYPLSFSWTGVVNLSGVTNNKDSQGYYWTSHTEEGDRPMMVFVRDYGIDTQNTNLSKESGLTVRCVVNRTDTTQRDKFISSPYNFPYSGYYDYGNGVDYQGSGGGWWSRSSFTTAGRAYAFGLNTNGGVYPQGSNVVGYGYAVRCVAE